MEELLDGMRVDIWLYRTRLVKSRREAVDLIDTGRVRLCRQESSNSDPDRVRKPSAIVRIGHDVIFTRHQRLYHVRAVGLPPRRGPAKEAQSHYDVVTIV